MAATAAAEAEGVGLLRTEFLFLDRPTEPCLEEQRPTDTVFVAGMRGRKVVARTLDAGADKPLAFASQRAEPNPALGVRGLRLDGLARRCSTPSSRRSRSPPRTPAPTCG